MTHSVPSPPPRRVLHVGCGARKGDKLPEQYLTPEWREVRLDINPDVEPDILDDMRAMRSIADCSFDALYSSHNLEHLYYHEVVPTLKEFYRVVTTGGHVLVGCPDMQQIARLIVEDRMMEPVFSPPSGPIAPIDMVYGYRVSLAKGNHFMAHKTGFTQSTLRSALAEAGFEDIRTTAREEPMMDIWALAHRLR